MEKQERKNNTGFLIDNHRKEKESHCDLTGIAKVEGKEFYVNVWKNKSKKGTDYLKISFQPIKERQ